MGGCQQCVPACLLHRVCACVCVCVCVYASAAARHLLLLDLDPEALLLRFRCFAAARRCPPAPRPLQALYEALREKVFIAERALLYALSFDFNVDHVYKV